MATDAANALAGQMDSAVATASGQRWGWSTSATPDTWNGAFHTREAAIEDARSHSYTTFFVVSGHCPDGQGYMPDADAVIDMIGQAASDDAGDAAEDFPSIPLEAQKELYEVLTAWSKKHLRPCEFWISDTPPEKIVPEPPVPKVQEPA